MRNFIVSYSYANGDNLMTGEVWVSCAPESAIREANAAVKKLFDECEYVIINSVIETKL